MSTVNDNLFSNLPDRRCQRRFCPTIGRFTNKRIILVGNPDDNIVGWCHICRIFICANCAIWEEGDKQAFWALDDNDELKRLCIRTGKYPASPQCRHCGEFLGESDETIILVNQDYYATGQP